MTLDEAKKIAVIAAWVDGGCSVCVGSVVAELNEKFPEFVWTFDSDKMCSDEAVSVTERTSR